jgi:pilus assembly protein CpaD
MFRSMGLMGLAASAACGLSACVQYASSDPGFPADVQARYPVVVASAPTTLDIYPVGGTLDGRSLGDLRAFAAKYRRFGSGEILILTAGSGGVATRAAEQVRQALISGGATAPIAISSKARFGAGDLPPIRVAFMGLKAEVTRPCGRWPDDLASGSSLQGWKNEPWENFGCETQATLAAQVDDPRDLVQARALGASDVVMRMRAIENVRKGQDPGTDWKQTVLTPIGGSSPSNPQ